MFIRKSHNGTGIWHLPVVFAILLGWRAVAAIPNRQEPPPTTKDFSSEAFVIEESSEHWAFESDGTSVHDLRFRVRVQSDAGVQRFGLIALPYEKEFETLEIRLVRVRKPDGSLVSTTAEDIQDMPSGISRQAPFYTDTREKHIPVKGLRTGDVLDFEARWRRTKPVVPGHFWLSFNVRQDEIALQQVIEVSVPRERAVKLKSPARAPQVSESGARRIYTWKSSSLERPVIDKVEDALRNARGRALPPEVQLTSFSSWQEVGRWYEQLQRDRIEPTVQIKEKAAELTRNLSDPVAKVRALYRYVSLENRYIGIAFGMGRYQPHSAAEVFKNQYGDCKDKHTLLAAMLSAVGIRAYPALLSYTQMIDEEIPSPGQFDHVISMVPLEKETLWLDTTAEVGPFGYLVPTLRDKPALVAYPHKEPAFERTPLDPPFPTSWVFKIDAKLDEKGTLSGKVTHSLRSDLEVRLRATLRQLPRMQWKDLVQQLSIGIGFGGEVSDVVASLPEATEDPLTISYTYTRKEYSDWNGRRISPPAPIIVTLPPEEDGKLPSSFWLGAPGEMVIETKVELPTGWSVTLPIPNKVSLTLADLAAYQSTYRQAGGILQASYRIDLKGREATGAEVKEYRAFAEKVIKDRNQFLALSTGRAQNAEEALLQLQQSVWSLPDSDNNEANANEAEAREAWRQGAMPRAVAQLQRAVELDAKFTRGWTLLAQLQMGAGRSEAGINALRKAIESQPQQPIPYRLLAYALTSLGRLDEAKQVWRDLLKADPENGDAHTNLASILRVEGRYQEAVPLLEKAVTIYPDRVRVLVDLASTYLKMGSEEKATEWFKEALKLSPTAATKNEVAYFLADAGKNLKKALEYANEAVAEVEGESSKTELQSLTTGQIRQSVTIAQYWDTLGWVHYQLGNFAEAEQYHSAAWGIVQTPIVAYHLGATLEKRERSRDAIRMYRFALQQRPRDTENERSANAARSRLAMLKVPESNQETIRGRTISSSIDADLSRERTIALPRLTKEEASAEFFVLLAAGNRVAETKFISGSKALENAGDAIAKAAFKVSIPEKSAAKIVRRGILACYPVSGCSFVLFLAESVSSVE